MRPKRPSKRVPLSVSGHPKTAVFLGAGASKAFGYPLTAELLPRLLTRLERRELFRGSNPERVNLSDRQWFAEKLFEFLPGLQDAQRRSLGTGGLGISVTDLLTQIDRALQHAEARATMPPEDLGRFRQLTERAIYETLLHGNDVRKSQSKASLARFGRWINSLERVGLVTTNYDAAVDRQLFSHFQGPHPSREDGIASSIDFGFPWRRVRSGELVERPARPRWQLLKLHGSVNWLRCSLCGQIYLNVRGAAGSKAFTRKLDEWNTCHCNDWARLRLHLVTPSLVRQTHDAHLLGIWQAALELFRTANSWIIIGYSLPPEDVAIRALFLRAWDGHMHKPQVTVVQRSNPQTEQTYRAFFPEKNLIYQTSGLDEFLRS